MGDPQTLISKTPTFGLPNFALFDSAKLESFRSRLKSLHFTEERVASRLKVVHIAAITPLNYPVYQAHLQQRFDALAVLISLFLIQSRVKRKEAHDALSSEIVDELLRAGVVIPAGKGAIAATVSLYPCCGSYFFTDHRFAPVSHEYYQAPDQPVMHLGVSSYALAYLTPKLSKRGRVVDLCTGSGVHAILTSSKAEHSIGVDLNPRAIEFARFNAALNGAAQRCYFYCESLYDGIRKHQKPFEMILANPPFVPSPLTGKDRLLSRDGGSAGDEILRPILEGLLPRMAPNGLAAITAFFVDQKRVSAEEKIVRWIGSESPVDILIVKFFSISPETLASWFTIQWYGDSYAAYDQRYKQWLDSLRSKQITEVTSGMLAVRKSQNGKSSFRTINVRTPTAPAHDVVAGEFKRLMTNN